MSMVLHAYRVEKSSFWDEFDNIRNYYIDNNEVIKAIRKKAKKDWTKTREIIRELYEGDEHCTRFQVFDFGDSYIFRVLESGFYFMNHSHMFGVEPVFYDGRTDVPEEDRQNYSIGQEIDKLIELGHYFIVDMITADFINNLIFNDALRAKSAP